MTNAILERLIEDEIQGPDSDFGMDIIERVEERILANVARLTNGVMMDRVFYLDRDGFEVEHWGHVLVPIPVEHLPEFSGFKIAIAEPWMPLADPLALLLTRDLPDRGTCVISRTWPHVREIVHMDDVIKAILGELEFILHLDDPIRLERDPCDGNDCDYNLSHGDDESGTRRITRVERIRDLASSDDAVGIIDRKIQDEKWYGHGVRRRNGGDGKPPPCPLAYQNLRGS